MAQTEQEKLIGVHPVAPHIFGVWWSSTDMPTTDRKKHRKLEEDPTMRNAAIDKLAQWIVDYHVTDFNLGLIARQKAILDKHDLGQYIDQLHLLPKADTTQKGNLGEIVLIEYLKGSRAFTPYVHKLHYNPNTEQSMKGDDVIEKGAFSKCLTEKQTYPMLWQHNTDQPIGIWEECSEDEHGLLLKGRLLVDDVQQAKEAYALYKNGIINGLSIGFMCNSCTWEERDRDFIRHLTEIKLFEVSLVTFPCNEKAIVTDVKSADLTIRSAEKALLDCGFSHKQAKTILSKGFKNELSD